jgi:hypothetical protein
MSIGPLFDAGVEKGIEVGREQILSALNDPSEEMLDVMNNYMDCTTNAGEDDARELLRALAHHLQTKG